MIERIIEKNSQTKFNRIFEDVYHICSRISNDSSFPLSTVSIYSRFLPVSVEYRNLSLDRFERRNKAARDRFFSSVPLEWLCTERENEISVSFTISNESLFCLYPRKNFEIIKQYREWKIIWGGIRYVNLIKIKLTFNLIFSLRKRIFTILNIFRVFNNTVFDNKFY